jgi:subtilisin family serine protease
MQKLMYPALSGLMLIGALAGVQTSTSTAGTISTAGTVTAADTITAAAPSPAFPQLLPLGKSWQVTLLTGDVVRMTTMKGRPPQVSVRPGLDRRSVLFRKDFRPDGSVRVFPLDVAAQIGKVYDPALFNVTTLVAEGDDDAKRADLPLIVQGGTGTARAFAAHRMLNSIHAVPVRQPKASAAGLIKKVRDEGVQHVWLDRKVRVQALDHNLEQVGAPPAWRAGATGKGVKVAVLDTGADATHPDLVGRIAEQRNFSHSPDTLDRFGHGTHVAATIAGTGAGANGERRGVAPDADLLIGKVVGDDGIAADSDIIAGMEWAAPIARIVNMSLGRFNEDPANGPVSQAVDRLTAQNGTLFVVAAGNSGDRDSIDEPGAAASALTVGAVDGADHVADFSSRGGRLMKPEIAAPGVEVIAARAKDTSLGHLIDEHYTALSGTSMATPHVAGAAADLLQVHPEWGPARLKAALASTAAAAGSVYDVGAGRLDLGAAVTASVVGDQATVAFGSVPHGATAPLTRQLSWTNFGSTAVTLRLAATMSDVGGHNAAALKLPSRVRVPAGGSAQVTLTLEPRRLTTAGLYSGAVTAKAAGVSLRTAVGAAAEPRTHALTLEATAISGTPAGALGGLFTVVGLDNPDLFVTDVEIGPDGVARLQIPDGTYAVFGTVDDTTPGSMRSAFVGNFELMVRGDTTLPVDASHAAPVRVSAPGTTPSPSSVHGLAIERSVGDTIIGTAVLGLDRFGEPGATPFSASVPRVRTGTLQAYVIDRLTDGNTVYDVLHNLGPSVPAAVNYRIDLHEMAQINERFGAINGKTEAPDLQKRYGFTPNGFNWAEAEGDVPAGSTRTDFVTGEPGVDWLDEAGVPRLGNASWISQLPIQHFDAGAKYTEAWVRQPFRPGPYSATSPTISLCAPSPSTRSRGNIHVELVDLQSTPDRFDCLTDDPAWLDVSSRTMKLYVGATPAGSTTLSHGDFSVPATNGTYRLRYDVDATEALPVSTRTATEWTFRSSPSVERIPLLTVDYALPLDLLNHPNGDTATLTVAQVAGSAKATITGLNLWTSLDDGMTWRPANVTGAAGRYIARLPHAAAGQAVSLRTIAADARGGKIDQTIIRAYFGS